MTKSSASIKIYYLKKTNNTENTHSRNFNFNYIFFGESNEELKVKSNKNKLILK